MATDNKEISYVMIKPDGVQRFLVRTQGRWPPPSPTLPCGPLIPSLLLTYLALLMLIWLARAPHAICVVSASR